MNFLNLFYVHCNILLGAHCSGKKQESQVETRVPEGFHTDFPSLKEQEKMSKKEKEELERQQRGDDIEKSGKYLLIHTHVHVHTHESLSTEYIHVSII